MMPPVLNIRGLSAGAVDGDGRSKSRQQFQQAWQWADRHVHDPLKHLEVYMLQCLLQTCLNLIIESISCCVIDNKLVYTVP